MEIYFAKKSFAAHRIVYSLDGTVVTLQARHLHQETNEPPAFAIAFDLETLRGLHDFDSHASINVLPWQSAQPFNLYAHTVGSKATGPLFAALNNANPICSILVPLESSPVSDWSIGFNVQEAGHLTLRHNEQGTQTPGLDVLRNEALPIVKFDIGEASVSKGGYIDLPFSIRTVDGLPYTGMGEATVFLESSGGALSNTRVRTNERQGVVRFFAQNVLPGDRIKVKAGFKYFVGTDSVLVDVK